MTAKIPSYIKGLTDGISLGMHFADKYETITEEEIKALIFIKLKQNGFESDKEFPKIKNQLPMPILEAKVENETTDL